MWSQKAVRAHPNMAHAPAANKCFLLPPVRPLPVVIPSHNQLLLLHYVWPTLVVVISFNRQIGPSSFNNHEDWQTAAWLTLYYFLWYKFLSISTYSLTKYSVIWILTIAYLRVCRLNTFLAYISEHYPLCVYECVQNKYSSSIQSWPLPLSVSKCVH